MISNSFKYTKTVFLIKDFMSNTGNKYRVVSQSPYLDKNKKIGKQGVNLTLMILEDSGDYGVDKTTGRKRDTNQFNTFDVTVLTGNTYAEDLAKGDIISLLDYDAEHSFVVDMNCILRFNGYRKLNTGNNK